MKFWLILISAYFLLLFFSGRCAEQLHWQTGIPKNATPRRLVNERAYS